MNQDSHQNNINAIVVLSCQDLSDSEAISLNLGLLLGMPLRNKAGYEKIQHLFNSDGSLHEMTKEALTLVLGARIQAIHDKK